MLAQQVQQALAAAFAFSGDQYATATVLEVMLQRRQGLGGAAVHTHIGQALHPVQRLCPEQGQAGMGLRAGVELFDPLVQRFRWQDGPLGVVLQEAVPFAGVVPEPLE